MNSYVVSEADFKHHVIKRLEGLGILAQSGDLLIQGHLISDPVQKILVNYSRNDWYGSTFLPIIESTAIESEKRAPGSGKLFLDLVTTFLSQDIRGSIRGISSNNDVIKIMQQVFENASGLCQKSDFDSYKKMTLGQISLEIVDKALEKYNLGDQIVVKNSAMRNTVVEKTVGYNFDYVSVNPFFLTNGTWKRNNVNIVLVDGIIESVGEIYHLLEKAHETGESYMIICSGMLPEPMNVIQNNYARKTIDVVVGTIKSNEFSIHAMVDLGTACLADPISALKGETITTSILRGTVKVDKIDASQIGVKIINPKSHSATQHLLKDVLDRSSKDPDIAHLFQKRVMVLSSAVVNVSIGRDDADLDKTVVEKVDTFLRSCPSILSRGFISGHDLVDLPKEMHNLLFNEVHLQPLDRITKALECYDSIKEQINRTGAIIINQRE